MPSLLIFRPNNQASQSNDEYIRDEVERLQDGNALEARLSAIDQMGAFSRAYVMGCGRSGTWLLAALLSTLESVDVLGIEVPVEWFGITTTTSRLLVLKRDYRAHERIERIPDRIHIVYAIRHPYDVLTSHNPNTNRTYHVRPHTYLSNMLSLQYLLDTKRPRTAVFRYEDVVARPEEAQSRLVSGFGLSAIADPSRIDLTFKAAPDVTASMHGIRAIDGNSVGNYLKDPEKIEYLRRLRPRLGRLLDWVADTFSYDLSLPGTGSRK